MIGTIVISAVLVFIVASIIIKLIVNKKKGKSSCGCGCGCGGGCSSCHAD
ncbi:FeoB-associated Cys-rich membrane protein [Treponema pectinovorum]|nr:FeoB-associated Cys-rich membrane protein [Treponema pectinovorum]